jgi:hypothetical protein
MQAFVWFFIQNCFPLLPGFRNTSEFSYLRAKIRGPAEHPELGIL